MVDGLETPVCLALLITNYEKNKESCYDFVIMAVINNIFVSHHFSLKNWVGRSVGSKNRREKCFFLIFLLTRLTPRIPEDKRPRASSHNFVLVKVKKSVEKA